MRLLPLFLVVASCAGGTASSEAPKAGENDCTLNWAPDDLEETVAALAKDFAGAGGIDAWAERHGRKPRLRIRKYVNRSGQSIDFKDLTLLLQKRMLKGGRLEILAEPEQTAGASNDGYEKGADLVGTIEVMSADEATATERVRMYTVYVTLTNVEDLSKVWLGEHMVRKMCEMPAAAE